ncbi:uncharacterized protein PHACADRAFT_264461 [Phanerochaete carnosa HHB-10118-sp]|uniref:Uncharacterized protein n=1 Tax=Phanerochaete carnosa (strain HHB-10118-sp) TaxID=650164 RepID=K5WID0_PHACS|nr:uncharacterized protein PHACADRAFT_264461 [Phanerochaete carnosa HHB-10118-sp]EKM49992.1 hypothetical protein PHACADRAFT_264461 [Phanerochaete carnosa HHB-10118-sp]
MASRYVVVAFAEKPRISVTKYLERRIIRAWKSITRKPQRASILMEDFVILNARRRSVMYPQAR